MALAALEDLLKSSMGLSAVSIGSATIARAVQERLSVCNLADPPAYLALVRASAAELQALIEAVVVPETWFFRDRHAFTALARLARDTWLPAHAAGTLSLLSLPCATGEEPYSMAMALADEGVPANRFRVDAVDISARSLAQGVRAVYGRNSFRGQELGFRDRYFEPTPEGYRVRSSVSQQVRFQQGNLFSPDFLPGVGIYDVIFCRNVLIYFDRPTQDRAIVVLDRLLHAAGVLFVAPAETALPASHGMTSTNEPLAFGFRKAGAPGARSVRAGVEAGAPGARSVRAGVEAGVPGARSVRAGVEAGVPGARSVRAGVEAGAPGARSVRAGVEAGVPGARNVRGGVEAAGVPPSPKRRAVRADRTPALHRRPVAPVRPPSAPPAVSRPRLHPKRQGTNGGALPASAPDLAEATRLANQGHFVEAAMCCEAHLRQSGPTAAGFHLMGLVRDATGNHAEAAACYRKALYLDPDHYDTQIQLALLMEEQGDPAGAQVLRNRARRLEDKQKALDE